LTVAAVTPWLISVLFPKPVQDHHSVIRFSDFFQAIALGCHPGCRRDDDEIRPRLGGLPDALAESSCVGQDGRMTLRSWFRRLSAYLLGVVDEYWAMREPAQYQQEDPHCDLRGREDAGDSRTSL
jgi:hypothetical protein